MNARIPSLSRSRGATQFDGVFVRLILCGLFGTVLLVACDGDPPSGCGAVGETQSCTCPDGSPGAQSCESSGEFGVCMCSPSVDAGGETDSGVDSGVDAGAPDVCGDGRVTGDEQCDDSTNDGSYGGCNADCTRAAFCGDGALQAREGCGALPAGLIGDWSFDDGTAANAVPGAGGAGSLMNGATIADGVLQLDGVDDYVRTTPLSVDVSERTMIVWVRLANTTQQGAGVFTLERFDGTDVFDSIVFAEQTSGQWMSGSNFSERTLVPDNGGATEMSTGLHMITIVYDDADGITMYRDDATYAPRYVRGTLVTYPRGETDVLLGLRHEDRSGDMGTSMGADAFLAGGIDRALLFDRALEVAEIGSVYRAGPGSTVCADDCAPPAAPSAPHLCYSFEDDTADSSGRGRDATAVGGTTYGSGRVGRAIRLDGTDGHVRMPDLSALGDVTFAGWMNLHSAPGTWTRFIDGGRNGNTLFMTVNNSAGRMTGRIWNGGALEETRPGVPIAATAEWHHLALTYAQSAGEVRFYYDGVLVGTTVSSGGFDTWGPGQNYYIGRSNWCPSCEPVLPALVDEVFVYDRTLASEEVSALYNGGLGVSCADVVAP